MPFSQNTEISISKVRIMNLFIKKTASSQEIKLELYLLQHSSLFYGRYWKFQTLLLFLQHHDNLERERDWERVKGIERRKLKEEQGGNLKFDILMQTTSNFQLISSPKILYSSPPHIILSIPPPPHPSTSLSLPAILWTFDIFEITQVLSLFKF